MNIHQLRCAVTVARMGSQTRAAEALYMSQPNLSKAIKELEQSCGFRIFTRSGNGMVPTMKGEAFLTRARGVLEQLDAMDAIYQARNRGTAYISLAVPRAGYIAMAVTEYVNTLDVRDGMELCVREAGTPEIIESVVSREADIGVVRYAIENQNKLLSRLTENGLSYLLYWSFRPKVIVSRQHALARKERLEAGVLQPYAEIVQEDEWLHADRACDGVRRRIRIHERGTQLELLSRAPQTYLWSSPMPKALLDQYGLVQLDSDDATQEYQDALIYLKGYTLSRWEQAFYDLLRHQIERMEE